MANWISNSCRRRICSQFGLATHQNDHQARRSFVEWAQNEIAVVPDFHKRILFNDEAHLDAARSVQRSHATVERSIQEDPNESICDRTQELDLCPSTLWKILRKNLGLGAYKIQLVQELKPNDHQARRIRRMAPKTPISEANPQVYVETPLHPEKLTVWGALWAGGIMGPYFFKNDEGHNVTVNGDRYRAMTTNLFIPELNNHDVQELWFQQDGANRSHSSCHNRFIERHVW
ncbi:putative DD41D transposase [Trichonephila clavipes]|nr:putative DD41D transposase [Trichonephila clavipes]